MKHAAAFLSLGLFLEMAATFWTLAQAIASGVFDEADCGVRALALYHNSRLPQNCVQLDGSVVWFDETLTHSTFTSCSGGLENPEIEQLCDCSKYDRVVSGCSWALASSTRDEIEGLCVAVPVIAVSSSGLQNQDGTSYDWLLDSPELEFQEDCRPLTPTRFGGITIALLVVSLIIGLVEAFVGYKRWKDPLQGAGLAIAGSAVEGAGLLSVWGLLMFSPHGIVQNQRDDTPEVSDNQFRVLEALLHLVAGVTLGGTVAEIVFHGSATARDLLPYLGVVGNASVWLGSAMTEVIVTAYLVWRLKFWKTQDEGEQDASWPELAAALTGLVLLEIVALLAVWAGRFFFARARSVLVAAKEVTRQDSTRTTSSGG